MKYMDLSMAIIYHIETELMSNVRDMSEVIKNAISFHQYFTSITYIVMKSLRISTICRVRLISHLRYLFMILGLLFGGLIFILIIC